MNRVPSATRANLPSMYAFSFVRAPPPKTPTASAPDSRAMSRKAPAIRSSASFQVAGRSGPPRRSRTSGEVGRSAAKSGSAALQPLRHRPPRLVGKSRGAVASRPPPPPSCTKSMAHCMAQ